MQPRESLEWRNRDGMFEALASFPVLHQGSVVLFRPIADKGCRTIGERPSNYIEAFQINDCFVFGVGRMKMRRAVFPPEHFDHDSEKGTDLRHSKSIQKYTFKSTGLGSANAIASFRGCQPTNTFMDHGAAVASGGARSRGLAPCGCLCAVGRLGREPRRPPHSTAARVTSSDTTSNSSASLISVSRVSPAAVGPSSRLARSRFWRSIS